MAMRRTLRVALLMLLAPPLSQGLLAPRASAGDPARDAGAPTAREVLERAFRARYEVDLTSTVELIMRNELGQERRRRFEAMSKRIDDRVHSVGRVVAPEYLRGMTVLTIEARDRSHDAFLYLPSLDRVRRVTTAQRGDAFFGTDVTYEDLERRRTRDYRLDPLAETRFEGEDAWLVRGVPLQRPEDDRVRFVIAKSDFATLRVEQFRNGDPEPYRVISARRASMVHGDGHVVPTHLFVESPRRGTRTEVVISDLHINPPIDDHAFSVTALESQRPLPVERGH
jgi:hypothetical protein